MAWYKCKSSKKQCQHGKKSQFSLSLQSRENTTLVVENTFIFGAKYNFSLRCKFQLPIKNATLRQYKVF